MTVVDVKTRDELNQLFKDNYAVVVDFAGDSWCVPCQRLAPHYEAASEAVEGVTFVHVDIDTAEPDLVAFYQIQGVPRVLGFEAGTQVGVIESRTAPKLTKEITALFKE